MADGPDLLKVACVQLTATADVAANIDLSTAAVRDGAATGAGACPRPRFRCKKVFHLDGRAGIFCLNGDCRWRLLFLVRE